MSEITSLFVIEKDGKKRSIVPKITSGGESYDPADLIATAAISVAEEGTDIGKTESLGEMTFAGHLLLETLHRLGNQKNADAIALDIAELYKSSYVFMLGMRAGKMFPEEMKIETAFDDGDTRLRIEPQEGDYESDEATDD